MLQEFRRPPIPPRSISSAACEHSPERCAVSSSCGCASGECRGWHLPPHTLHYYLQSVALYTPSQHNKVEDTIRDPPDCSPSKIFRSSVFFCGAKRAKKTCETAVRNVTKLNTPHSPCSSVIGWEACFFIAVGHSSNSADRGGEIGVVHPAPPLRSPRITSRELFEQGLYSPAGTEKQGVRATETRAKGGSEEQQRARTRLQLWQTMGERGRV